MVFYMKFAFAGLLLASTTLLPGAGRYTARSDMATGPDNTRLLIIADEESGIEAAVAPEKGGELSGLRVRVNGDWVETLYRARDYTPTEAWSGKAPLLFPATGRSVPNNDFTESVLKGFAYLHYGRRYPMPIHGFVREMPWSIEEHGAAPDFARVRLSRNDTAATRRQYPYGFRLDVLYRLAAGVLEIVYTVTADNSNGSAMPFSIGNHITFRTPLLEGSDWRAMRFETPSSIEYQTDPPGLPNGKSRPCSYADAVPLGEIDANTAISLGGYDGEPYMVLCDPAGLAIRMSHLADALPDKPVILFNVWGDPAAGYFSPEPWVGLQNSLNLKQGLVELEPGESWRWTIRILPERDSASPPKPAAPSDRSDSPPASAL